MNKLAILANVAEVLGVLIVVGGLFFAVLQMRQFRQQRREMAAIELFRFFGNPHFARAYKAVLQLPKNTSSEDICANLNDIEDAAMLIGTTMENIGVMTFQRIVPFKIVSNLIGTSTIILWDRLHMWVEAMREDIDNPYAFEWFQWLADRLSEHQDANSNPAYKSETDWQPANVKQQF
jgi:hypothetical protein